MSSVIDFLEKMGSDAQWRHASQEELEVALAEADIAAPESSAILAKDATELQALLRQVPLFAIMIPPDEEEGEEDDEEEGDEKHQPSGLYSSLSATSLQHA
jgi:hypothetical protein